MPTCLFLRRTCLLVALAGTTSFCLPSTVLHPLMAQPLPDRIAYSGRITAVDGAPLGGAAITLRRQDSVGSTGFWGNVTYTDARGDFTFADAEAGTYFLSIEANGYAPVYNRSVTVGEGNAAAQPISLVTLAQVKANVTGGSGEKLPNQSVALLLRPETSIEGVGPRILRGQSKEDGVVTFEGIVPGEYNVVAVGMGRGYAELSKINIMPATATAPLDIKFQAGGALRVAAVAEGTERAVGGAQVIFRRLSVGSLEPPSDGPGLDMLLYTAGRADFSTRDGSGAVEINDLVPGKYRVEVNFNSTTTAPAQTIEIEAGKTTELAFKNALEPRATLGVQINGKDGKPVAEALVLITLLQTLPDEQPAIVAEGEERPVRLLRETRLVTTDAEGKASIYPLVTGHWKATGRRANGPTERSKISAPVEIDLPLEGGSIALKVPD
jgi:hypothetical protein